MSAAELPRYRCHKEVWALKIKSVEVRLPTIMQLEEVLHSESETQSDIVGAVITPEDPRYAPFKVTQRYTQKHQPVAGGYYVVYADGYKSFSPAEAFEDGYTLIGEKS